MKENKITSYLLYAIGEIVLVVIGILIAVSIDNWNTEQSNQAKQKKQLLLIRNEMANNLVLLEREWEKINIRLVKQEHFLDIMNSSIAHDTISEKVFAHLLYDAYNLQAATPIENAALNEIVSSGGLKDIKNDSIRNVLSSWDARLINIKKQELRIDESNKSFTDYMRTFDGFSMRQYIKLIYPDRGLTMTEKPMKNRSILSSLEFENIAVSIYGQSRRLSYDLYPHYKNDLLKIISSLDKELKTLWFFSFVKSDKRLWKKIK